MEKMPRSNTEYNKNLKEQFSINDKIEQFYSKPESDEELSRRVGMIKDIPDDINTPKVLLKLGNPDHPDKFVHMKDEDSRDYVIALPIEKRAYHRDIANFCRKLYDKDLKVLGGGWIKREGEKLVVYGESLGFGEADKDAVKDILAQAFPDLEIEAVSLAEVEVTKQREEYNKALEQLQDEVSKDLYADVVQEKGIRMGYDATVLPKVVSDAEREAAYMTYRSENGSSFGIDTLFVGYKDKDKTFKTKEVAQTRWTLEVVDAKIENEILTLDIRTEGENMQISLPLDSTENVETFSNLNDTEKTILEMYKNNRFVYEGSKNSKIWHGSS